MKWKGDLDVASVDTAFLRDAFAAFLVSARNLGVDNEHIVDPETGQPLDHLRVHSGVHPRPGVVYESIWTAPSQGAAPAALTDVTSRALISLEADNEQQLRVSGVDEEAAWHLEVERPAKARKATGSFRFDTGPGRWMGGEVRCDVFADVDRVCSLGQDSADVADLTVQHRRFHLTLDVAASRVGNRIVFALRGEGRGSGIARPAVALISVLFRRQIKKVVDEALADFDESTQKLTAEIDAFDTPEAMAHEMLRSMLQAGVEPVDRA